MKKLNLTILLIFFSGIYITYMPLKDFKIIREDKIFSIESLYNYIISIGISYPHVVIAQAKIETGHFTSRRFIENNNLFGMKFPKQRETTAIGIDKEHSIYIDWTSAVDDYKLWQDEFINNISSKDEYISYLGENYAEDKHYISMIKQIIK